MKTSIILMGLSCWAVPVHGAEHRFACADYVQGKAFIVAADGKVEWEYPAPNCNDL
jgi:hypothetical protein